MMTVSVVVAYLDDGPREGEAVQVDVGPDHAPPQQLVISDPFGMDEPAKQGVEVGASLRSVTTYYLHEPATAANGYVYRTGAPVD